ncbi:UNVERIFIED_CONTAM: hypothetical protein FKN15_006016 [Acipenser sinensis]
MLSRTRQDSDFDTLEPEVCKVAFLKHKVMVAEKAEKRQLANKQRWDKTVIASSLEEGARVLVRNVNLCRKHKIADHWEHAVHTVVRQVREELPVYVVRPEKEYEPERTLHRDMLQPCGLISAEGVDDRAVPEEAQCMRTRQTAGTLDGTGNSDEDDAD